MTSKKVHHNRRIKTAKKAVDKKSITRSTVPKKDLLFVAHDPKNNSSKKVVSDKKKKNIDDASHQHQITKKKSLGVSSGRMFTARHSAVIKVVGVGGGGGNAISRMKDDFIRGVEFIAINTDAQALEFCHAHRKVHIGKTLTRGLGTGMDPKLGEQAAEENRAEIVEALAGADLVFITAGLGGGTGSGASTIVADIARESGALTIAVNTRPFSFEGGHRSKIAEQALMNIRQRVDSHIVVPNDKIFSVIGNDTSISKAFEAIDNVLRGAVQGIADLITINGIINVDYADVRTIMKDSGSALVGIGMASGKDRAVSAVNHLLNFPLLEVSIDGAKGLLFGISGGRDMKMNEINDVARAIVENADSSAKIIFGAYYDRKVPKGKLKVTLIATGFEPRGASTMASEADLRSSGSSDTMSIMRDSMGQAGVSTGLPEKTTPKIDLRLPVDRAVRFNEEEGVVKNDIDRNDRASRRVDEPIDLSGEVQPPKKKTTEIWDIPAFLRRKKK